MAYKFQNWFTPAIFFAASTCITGSCLAQTALSNKFSIDVGPEFGVVTGFEASYHGPEVGADVVAQYSLNKTIALTFSTGYDNMFGKSYSANDAHFSYSAPTGELGVVPIKAGIRLFTGAHFYLTVEGGSWVYTNGYDFYYSAPDNTDGPNFLAKERYLLLAGGLGWSLKKIDIGFHFENFQTREPNYNGVMYYNLLTFNVAYIIR